MKKGLLAAIIVVTGLALAACGGKETNSTSSGTWEQVDDVTTGTAEATGSDFATEVEEKELEPIEIRMGRLMLEVPGYYKEDADFAEEQNADYAYVYEDVGGGAVLLFALQDIEISEESFRNSKDPLAESIMGGLSNEAVLTSSKATEYMEMPGFSYDYETTDDGIETTLDMDIFMDTSASRLYIFVLMEYGDSTYDIASDYGNMMRNAQWANASAETETSRGSDFAIPTETEESASSSSSDGSGVTPEIKEALDSYEELMNQYVDFMLRYQNASSSDALSMLGDYTKMLSQYTDAMSALSEIDQGSLDADDLAYYLDVTNRVTKRLLEVAQ